MSKKEDIFAEDLPSEADASLDLDKLDTKTLLAMFIQVQKQAAKAQEDLASAQVKLGESIIESRKPYVSPADLAAKKQQFEERLASMKKTLQDREDRKKYCTHRREDGKYNVKWQEHSNSITKGVCGNCFSEFDTRNAEDLMILRLDPTSIKNMGRAGQHARRGYIG